MFNLASYPQIFVLGTTVYIHNHVRHRYFIQYPIVSAVLRPFHRFKERLGLTALQRARWSFLFAPSQWESWKKMALGCKVVTFELLWWMEGIGLPLNADKRLGEPRDIWQGARGGGHTWFSTGSSAWKWEAMWRIPHFVVFLSLPLVEWEREQGLSFHGLTQSLSHAIVGCEASCRTRLMTQGGAEGVRGWEVG